MRWLALVFAALILAIQYPMWLGKGGWLQVREYDRQVALQRDANAKLKARNDALDADVRDLKTGYEAIEERARADLGMIRQDEVFFQIQTPGAATRPVPAPAATRPVPTPAATPPAPPGPLPQPGEGAERQRGG
ncbi:MAG TPA: cell division protein FtsB [Casimicrobiaceae bacterium]|nr:cell division protein FtsB [Casimicrobiaceae bacterium]